MFQRIDSANIRLGGACANSDRNRRAADIGKAAGRQFPLLEKILHHRPDQDGDVVRFAIGHALLQLRRAFQTLPFADAVTTTEQVTVGDQPTALQVVDLEGGHPINLDQPSAFNAAVRAFLAALR